MAVIHITLIRCLREIVLHLSRNTYVEIGGGTDCID